jgi:hypothetical protein
MVPAQTTAGLEKDKKLLYFIYLLPILLQSVASFWRKFD